MCDWLIEYALTVSCVQFQSKIGIIIDNRAVSMTNGLEIEERGHDLMFDDVNSAQLPVYDTAELNIEEGGTGWLDS
jgi:hypothetical protein